MTTTPRRWPRAQADVTTWDSFRPIRAFQPIWVGLAVLFLVPSVGATYLRISAPTDDGPALLASFISYAIFTYTLSLSCFIIALLRARHRRVLSVLTAITALLLGCHLCWVAPFFVSDHRRATTPAFTLMSLNTRHGGANPAEVAQVGRHADVVILLEATSTGVHGLQPYGWDQRFPYSVGELEGAIGDTIMFSRFPLSDGGLLGQTKFQQRIASVAVPGIGQVRIIAAHPCNPFCGSNLFAAEHRQLRAAADANLGVPLIVAGDLNATDDHGPIRALKADGLESVTDILGAGWLPTYPANRRLIPPLLPIDHILVNHFLTATSIHRFRVANTDHLGLLAQIAGAGHASAPAAR